jgi:hypothetical protein
MKTKMVLMAMMGCLGLTTAVDGAVTLTLIPGSGGVSGLAGSTVGWGFTLDSASDFAVISSSNFCLGNSGVSSLCIAPTIGTYSDFIATNYTIAGPAPESPAVTEAFDTVSGMGVGSFRISATAVVGAVNAGQIVATYDLYSVDPNAANFNPRGGFDFGGEFSDGAGVGDGGGAGERGTGAIVFVGDGGAGGGLGWVAEEGREDWGIKVSDGL